MFRKKCFQKFEYILTQYIKNFKYAFLSDLCYGQETLMSLVIMTLVL